MRVGVAAWLVAAGCGRFGFDASDAGASAGDARAPLVVEALPCDDPHVLVEGVPQTDKLSWIRDGAGEHVVGVYHLANDHHVMRRYTPSAEPGGVTLSGEIEVESTLDLGEPDLLPVDADTLVAYSDDFFTFTTYTMRLGPGLAPRLEANQLPDLCCGRGQLARTPAGVVATIGINTQNGAVVALPLDGATGAATGTFVEIAPQTGGVGSPSLVATDTGFVAVWQEADTGDCRLRALGPDLMPSSPNASVFRPAAGACVEPRAVWLAGASVVVVAASSYSDNAVHAGLFDRGAAEVVVPVKIAEAAEHPELDTAGDAAWIAWQDTSGPIRVLRHGLLTATGELETRPGTGDLADMGYWIHNLATVGDTTVLLWAAPANAIAATRLCR